MNFPEKQQVLILRILGVLMVYFGGFYFFTANGPAQLFMLIFVVAGIGVFLCRRYALILAVLVFGLPVLVFVSVLATKIIELDFRASFFAVSLALAFLLPLVLIWYLRKAFK